MARLNSHWGFRAVVFDDKPLRERPGPLRWNRMFQSRRYCFGYCSSRQSSHGLGKRLGLEIWGQADALGFGPIAAQCVMAGEFPLPNQGLRFGRSKHHLFVIMCHDPVQIVTVPAVLPVLSKLPGINCVSGCHGTFLALIINQFILVHSKISLDPERRVLVAKSQCEWTSYVAIIF